jgi:hypothetical protein
MSAILIEAFHDIIQSLEANSDSVPRFTLEPLRSKFLASVNSLITIFFFSFLGRVEAECSWYVEHCLAYCISPG